MIGRLVTEDDLHPEASETGLACIDCGEELTLGGMCFDRPLGMVEDSFVSEVVCLSCAEKSEA